jgi:putative ABC transport system substrate-binding protein
MARKTIIIVWLVAFALAPFRITDAQQAKKIPRIGFLSFVATASSPGPNVEAFRQGLRDLGYVEGQNIVIEYRFAEGKENRLPDLAAELVRLKVDIIVAQSTETVVAAKNATSTIPIVMTNSGDPVGSGLVASLARPGGNVTGMSMMAGPEISGKQLELLKETIPKLTHVAVLTNPASRIGGDLLREAELAARSLGVQLFVVEARDASQLDGAFTAIKKAHAGALLMMPVPIFQINRSRIAALAASSRIPAMYPYSSLVDAGGLMSYGANLADSHRRSATYVDKILKGAKPADLPVEQPTKFEFIINLKAAKQIGLTIPPNVLARADKVIK